MRTELHEFEIDGRSYWVQVHIGGHKTGRPDELSTEIYASVGGREWYSQGRVTAECLAFAQMNVVREIAREALLGAIEFEEDERCGLALSDGDAT